MTREALLARTFVELSDTLVDEFDVVDLLTLLADRCVEVLDVAAAGIMLAGASGELRVMTSSSDAMRVLELFELQAHEGPCLDCYHTGRPVLNEILTADAPDVGRGSQLKRSRPGSCRCKRSRCDCAATSSARSTCSTPTKRH